MNLTIEGHASDTCWFVGAMHGKRNDQTDRFIREGIWENGYTDKYLEIVKSIQAGDFIAIKAAYTRKNGLPFEGHGHTASVMDIKAVGIVKENLGDGRRIKVEWEKLTPYKQWYFFTGRQTIWKVSKGNWATDALIAFAFEGQTQDLDMFRNFPYWSERFGDRDKEFSRFAWTGFYEELADKILAFKNHRNELISRLFPIYESEPILLSYLQDQKQKDISSGFLEDICPFTLLGTFNRGLKSENRIRIATKLAEIFDISTPVPSDFNGIPLLNAQRAWFFGFSYVRKNDDISNLWDFYEKALAFANENESDDDEKRSFIEAYNKVSQQRMVGWNLSMGLYWIRPWIFPTLEGNSRNYIENKLNIKLGRNGENKRCSGDDYLNLIETLNVRFQEGTFPIHSFPELSLKAWTGKKPIPKDDIPPSENGIGTTEEENRITPYEPYSISSIINEGCFLPQDKLEKILASLRSKKNLILQGAPGTGKTWLAKKIALALIESENDDAIRIMQFHPNVSYEDFIRGWRPSEDGKLVLTEGPFMQMIHEASENVNTKYVFVIEEINRGNPAQIFGEMLTLLEADKRTPSCALELSYKKDKDERIHIPGNVYIIGTMNIADRSLALVDIALRRRFAFVDLEPTFGEPWRQYLHKKHHFDLPLLEEIERRILTLNTAISKNKQLGKQFRIGHSYVVPAETETIQDPRKWFIQVVETQINPLIDEYFFDAENEAEKLKLELLKDF